MRFSEFAEVNPKVGLLTKTNYSFVEMADIEPGIRYVQSNQIRELKGGARFKNGDTLFARITPCLENGKIAQVKNLQLGVGFGSTEFFVFRGKAGVSIDDFIYYLASSEIIRQPAEKSMSGATGRQRAEAEVVKNIEIPIYSLEKQKEVVSILGAYDDLIENNNRRIALLEEIAQNLYREWFINFRFPNHQQTQWQDTSQGKIPLGWEIKKLAEIATVNPESITKKSAPEEIHYIDISSVNTGSVEEIRTLNFVEAPSRARRKVSHADIIWATVRPNRKQFAYLANPVENTIVSTGFAVLRATKVPASFLYQATTTDNFTAYLVNHATGAAYPAVNASVFENAEILIPDENLLAKFDQLAATTMKQIAVLKKKNNNLKQQRDMLLPKLISIGV